MDVQEPLTPMEAEKIRYARRLIRPFSLSELAVHLRTSVQYARRILHRLVKREFLVTASGRQRYRTYVAQHFIRGPRAELAI